MKRIALFSVLFSLIISSAVPTGAVFASEEATVAAQDVTIDDVLDMKADEMLPEEQVVPEPTIVFDEREKPILSQTQDNENAPVALLSEPVAEIANEDALEEAALFPAADTIVITEIQTRGASGASAELVEIYNASTEPIDITGWCLQYAAAAGTSYRNAFCVGSSDGLSSTRVMLPAGSYAVFVTSAAATVMPGFFYDGILSGTMADSGRLRIIDSSGGVIDLIGWGTTASEYQGGGQAPAIPTTLPIRSLQRISHDGQYQNTLDNKLDFALAQAKTQYETGALYEVADMCTNITGIQELVPEGYISNSRGDCIDRSTINFCDGIIVSEVAANVNRQYIELANVSQETVSLEGCRILTNRSTSIYAEFGMVLMQPGAYSVIYIEDTPLRLTKSTTGIVYLLASDGETEVGVVSYEDLSSDTSWSLFPGGWQQTYELTPGAANKYAQFAACPIGQERNLDTGRCRNIVSALVLADCGEGRERNPETGRCRNIPGPKELAPCREGQYRSEETNRCRSIAAAASSLKPCADDQFRNPETNRCKKIASTDDLADCGEGRERNPATNRCRNVLGASTLADTLPFPVEEAAEGAQRFAGWWTLGIITALGLGYGAWEWREELANAGRRASRFIARSK